MGTKVISWPLLLFRGNDFYFCGHEFYFVGATFFVATNLKKISQVYVLWQPPYVSSNRVEFLLLSTKLCVIKSIFSRIREKISGGRVN